MTGQLSEPESHRLRRWQRLMVGTFVATWVYLLLVIAAHLFIKPEAWMIQLALVPVLGFVFAGVVLQFSGRCPRCGYRLGRQSGLLVPKRCRSCGVLLQLPKESP